MFIMYVFVATSDSWVLWNGNFEKIFALNTYTNFSKNCFTMVISQIENISGL